MPRAGLLAILAIDLAVLFRMNWFRLRYLPTYVAVILEGLMGLNLTRIAVITSPPDDARYTHDGWE